MDTIDIELTCGFSPPLALCCDSSVCYGWLPSLMHCRERCCKSACTTGSKHSCQGRPTVKNTFDLVFVRRDKVLSYQMHWANLTQHLKNIEQTLEANWLVVVKLMKEQIYHFFFLSLSLSFSTTTLVEPSRYMYVHMMLRCKANPSRQMQKLCEFCFWNPYKSLKKNEFIEGLQLV